MIYKMINYNNTSKKEWFEIAVNLAMQLSEDDEQRALIRLQQEKNIIQRNR